jgi:uncharacterized repeat protein (TIGR01451 family)
MITNTAILSWTDQSISDSISFEFVLFDLMLTKTVSSEPLYPGDLFTYTVDFANDGCDSVIGAVLSDILPVELSYITSTPPGEYQDGVVTWPVDIPGGESGQVTLIGQLYPTVTPGLTVTNEAHLWWMEGPPLSSTVAFLVQEPACEQVEDPAMSWHPSLPFVGETVTFTGTVAAGDPPITFTWSLGGGSFEVGDVVTHSYVLPGSYDVILTATNCGGSGVAVISETIVIESHRLYLPLIFRSAP